MSHLYLTAVAEERSRVTKSASTKLEAHVASWDSGVLVKLERTFGGLVYKIYRTGGSNDPNKLEELMVFKEPLGCGRT